MNPPKQTETVSSLGDPELADMAEHFFGYGRWDAPFWFVEPKAGMGCQEY